MRVRRISVKFAILAEGGGFVLKNTESAELLPMRPLAAEADVIIGGHYPRLKACFDAGNLGLRQGFELKERRLACKERTRTWRTGRCVEVVQQTSPKNGHRNGGM